MTTNNGNIGSASSTSAQRSRQQQRSGGPGSLANGHTGAGRTVQLAAHLPGIHTADNPAQRYGDSMIQREETAPPDIEQQEPEPKSPVMSEQQFSVLLDALEQRVLSEIERRGGRHGGIF